MKELQFSLTKKDFQQHLNIVNIKHFTGALVILFLGIPVTLTATFLLFNAFIDILQTAGYYPANANRYVQIVFNLIIITIIIMPIYRCLASPLIKKLPLLDPQGYVLSPQKLSIDAKGLYRESDYHKVFSDWRGIIEIQETKNYILFYTDRAHGYGYLVPKTAFETPEDAAAFLEQARGYWHKAGGGAKNEKGKSDDTAEKS